MKNTRIEELAFVNSDLFLLSVWIRSLKAYKKLGNTVAKYDIRCDMYAFHGARYSLSDDTSFLLLNLAAFLYSI